MLDFPHPLGPINDTSSPRLTTKLTSRTAMKLLDVRVLRYTIDRLDASIATAPSGPGITTPASPNPCLQHTRHPSTPFPSHTGAPTPNRTALALLRVHRHHITGDPDRQLCETYHLLRSETRGELLENNSAPIPAEHS